MADVRSVNQMLADTFEPKRSNRWFFQFADDVLPQFIAKTFARPTFTQESVTIDYINSKRYLAGKFEWGTIAMTLADPIAPSAAQKVMEWARLAHETISGRDGYAAFYKKDFSLNLMDPVGVTVEQWDIKGAWITDADFGGLDYTSGDPVEISLTVRPDECILRY